MCGGKSLHRLTLPLTIWKSCFSPAATSCSTTTCFALRELTLTRSSACARISGAVGGGLCSATATRHAGGRSRRVLLLSKVVGPVGPRLSRGRGTGRDSAIPPALLRCAQAQSSRRLTTRDFTRPRQSPTLSEQREGPLLYQSSSLYVMSIDLVTTSLVVER